MVRGSNPLRQAMNNLVMLREMWHEAELDSACDARAAEYRALLDEPAASDAPTVP